MSQLKRVQEAVERSGLGALLLMDDKNIYYATGFMPTDSAALITPSRAWLVTDSRYIEDAGAKCSPRRGAGAGHGRAAARRVPEGPRRGSVRRDRRGGRQALLRRLHRPGGQAGPSLFPGRRPGGRPARPQGRRRVGKPHRGAQRISEKALEETLAVIRPGMSESELAAELTYRMMRHGAERRTASTPSPSPARTPVCPTASPAGRSSPAATSSPWTSAASRTATAPT